jgi:hypothetical protein
VGERLTEQRKKLVTAVLLAVFEADQNQLVAAVRELGGHRPLPPAERLREVQSLYEGFVVALDEKIEALTA